MTASRPVDICDANVWAYQFCQQNPAASHEAMLWWFTDALECGLKTARALASRAPAQPASTEPSACAGFNGCEGSGYAIILGTGGDAAPCDECKLGKAYQRAESAEAQLAAVREALNMPAYYVEKDPNDLLGSEIAEMQSCLSEAFALLTAPSADAEENAPDWRCS